MAEHSSVSNTLKEKFRTAVATTGADRANVRAMVAVGQWTRADPDDARSGAFLSRIYARGGAEALQGRTNDLLPVGFVIEGAAVRRAVAKVVVDTDREHKDGSGFLVSRDLFLTNQHVVADEAAARETIVIFDYEDDAQGVRHEGIRFRLNPDKFQLFSPEDGGLDYALVAIGECVDGAADSTTFGYCALANTPDRHMIGMSVNIIQHPGGRPKQIAVRNNLLTHRSIRTLLYETDTEVGTSGAPVFNDDWDVVALHHYGEPFTEKHDERGRPIPANVNEGIRISALYNDLGQRAAGLSATQRPLLDEALSLWTKSTPKAELPQLERRPPEPEESLSYRKESVMTAASNANELKMAIPVGNMPVELTLRVGTDVVAPPGRDEVRSGVVSQLSKVGGQFAPPQLRQAAEAKRLDKDYSNRNGFDERFIKTVPVSLTKILAPVTKRIAPLVEGPKSGELKYQNFSVFMDSRRDFAILTATNIDGETYLHVDRDTGEVTDRAEEGETWYKDRRILEQHYVGQEFYSGWSHKFDRGHLTRRTDPTWGDSDEIAERANADTYHFTNCTPQHFRFNQSAKFWQGIERYVLEQGVLQPGRAKRLTVLQGPVLDRDDPWAGNVQVPAAFWKIVIWNGARGPRAVGMLANQSDLFSEDRVNLGRPKADQPIHVRQFHAPFFQIAKLTNLDLSDFQPIDTFQKGLPGAGEAAAPITKWSDLTL